MVGSSMNAAEQPIYKVRRVASPYPYLPEGYWYKGGVPRETLRRLIHPLSSPLTVRDFDIFRTKETEDEHDHALSLQYLSDDYEFGHGIEVVEDLTTYFKSRDLTVNEVALHHERLGYTKEADSDLRSLSLRPTRSVCNAHGEPPSSTWCKAVRLTVEGRAQGVSWNLCFPILPGRIALFDIALNLDRSFLSGLTAGIEFVETVKEYGFLQDAPYGIDGVKYAIEESASTLHQGIRFFRNIPKEVLSSLSLNT